MADGEKKKVPLTLEQAPSNRSTCKATGEKIEKGQWRVGMLAFRAGFESMQWQKAVPFLEACYVEQCTKANSGTCKITAHKFQKGEVRFVCTNGKQKLFFTVLSAAKVLQPIIAEVKEDFSPEQFKGIAELAEPERAQIFKEFKVSAQKAKAFNKQHPPQAQEAEPAKTPKPKAGTKRKQAPEWPSADAEENKVQPTRKKQAAAGTAGAKRTKKATAEAAAASPKVKVPPTPGAGREAKPSVVDDDGEQDDGVWDAFEEVLAGKQ
jgi:hypothetical protein